MSCAPTRVGEYQRAIDTVLRAFRSSSFAVMRKELLSIITAMFEVNDLIEIHKSLAGRFDNSLVRHFRTYASGPVSYMDENVQTSSNIARNIAFELVVMAKLTRSGIPLDFRMATDVAAQFDGQSVLFECKRPQSLTSLESNIKKACRQLEAKYGNAEPSLQSGIIAIDITKLINPDFMLYAQNDEHALDAGLSRLIDGFVSEYERLWQRQRDKRTIAVLLRLSLVGVNKARNDMLTYCQQFAITPLHQVGERSIETARALATAMHETLGRPA